MIPNKASGWLFLEQVETSFKRMTNVFFSELCNPHPVFYYARKSSPVLLCVFAYIRSQSVGYNMPRELFGAKKNISFSRHKKTHINQLF